MKTMYKGKEVNLPVGEVKHTPTPWTSEVYNAIVPDLKPKGYGDIKGPDGRYVCESLVGGLSIADAQFIVRAVNNHHHLLHQLKKAIHQMGMRKDRTEKEDETIATGRKTIDQAEGK